MMLSSRRLWCGLIACAVFAAGMVIEPARQMAKRYAVEYAFDGSISAADIQLHRKQELLEVSDLRAAQSDDSVHVDVTAERALIKVDMPRLLDKRLSSPKVKLQGVRISLASLSVKTPTIAPPNPWKASLQEVLSAFQWEELRDDCEALLKSDNVLNELDKRMRGWLLRSQQIMFHADQLTREIQGYSNPLRHANEIQKQLGQLEQLRSEQDGLQKQFNGISTVLASHLKEIELVGRTDIDAMRSKRDVSVSSLQTLAAEQLVSEWAIQLLWRQMRMSQSVTTLMRADDRTNPFDVDVRNGDPTFSFSGIEADGILSDSLQQFPFTATGNYSTVKRTSFQLGRDTTWSVRFQADNVATQLDLLSEDSKPEWKLKSASSAVSDESASSLIVTQTAAPHSSDTLTSQKIFQLDAMLAGRQLSGKARMNIGMYQTFTKLPCAGNADLSATDVGVGGVGATINEQWIEFTLSGTASDTQVKLDSKLPSDFTEMITSGIRKQIETQCTDSESKLKIALNTKTEEFSQRLELAAKTGQQTVASQRETLTAIQRELEQNLQSRESLEYARLPAKTNTSR